MSPRRTDLIEAYLRKFGTQVRSGPFAGMRYVQESVGSELLPKLLGCYEAELHGVLEECCAGAYSTLLNIGCGEGYYAVGFALRQPQARVHAFDTSARAQDYCRQLALLNRVSDRITLHGHCTLDTLRPLLRPGALVVCDCEGGELDLLRPDLLPALAGCDLLVELHDPFLPGLTDTLLERFAATHTAQIIPATARTAEEFDALLAVLETRGAREAEIQALREWTREEKEHALSEARPPGMGWAYFQALVRPSADDSAPEPGNPEPEAKRVPPVAAVRPQPRITACILARNEERRIEPALQSLVGWTDQILVIDNESEDATAAIAACYAEQVLTAPRSLHFDAARNLAIEPATGEWIFYLDADERVPPRLGPVLRQLVAERGEEFEALYLPFQHHIFGKWLQHCGLWPGYTRPQLLKKGCFHYNEELHSGAQVNGRTLFFPADDPDLAIRHHSYDDLRHYFQKMNAYTDGEALTLLEQGQPHGWQAQLAAFVQDWQSYYDAGSGAQDGMHGFAYSLLGAIYRCTARTKLWDLRRQRGETNGAEPVPHSVSEMLRFMTEVAAGGPEATRPWLTAPAPARPSRMALLQCARGDQTALLDLTRRHHEAYAASHGMDYQCRFGYAPSDRHPGWDKIAFVLEVLRAGKYDEICWLDADTLIYDTRRDLREALPPGKWLGMARHGQPSQFNNGVMYLRCTPEALRFFERVWDEWPVNHAWEDQEGLLRVLRREPERWPGVTTVEDAWNSTVQVNESPAPVVLAWHGYGPTGRRLAAMQEAVHQLERAGRFARTIDPEVAPVQAEPIRLPANPVSRERPEPVDFRKQLGRPLRICWEGHFSPLSSLAHVNREFCLGLLGAGDIELTLREPPIPWGATDQKHASRFEPVFSRLDQPLSGNPDLTVRHFFPPRWDRPASGKLVVMQPWEYAHLPEEWVQAAGQADEIWADSRFVRDVYARSGVPAERVRVVPLGYNPDSFTPTGESFPLPTGKSTRFLFVGGAIARKGADLLLQAYLQAFSATDDVALIVKDQGTRTFYQGQTGSDAFRSVAVDPNTPEVAYLDEDLDEAELAALYRSCHCLVLPYRGEGFALSPLEGMACGLLPIVTAGGSTDDYLDDDCALRLPHRRRTTGGRQVGPWTCVGDPWQLEPDLGALVQALRWVHEHPTEARERGVKAHSRVRESWSWERATGELRTRLAGLISPERAATTAPAASATPWGKASRRKAVAAAPARKIEPKRVELSLCMIVRDEEPRLAECLQSIAPHVDEMILVDTGSKDQTREIARDCGARVFELPWPDSFAAARNASLEQARGEWIFWMDADDVITAECGLRLRNLIRSRPNGDAAFQIQVRLPAGPDDFSESVVDHVKLFPNRSDLRFEHRIHEQILGACKAARLEILFTDLFVTHRNYDRSEAGQARKRRRDFHLLELDLRERPEHPFVLFNLGMTYLHATKEYELAVHYLRRCLARSDWRDSIVRKAYAMLTTARLCQRDWPEAVAANEAGRRHYPDDAELLFQGAQIYQQLGQFDQAHTALQRLLEGHEEEHYRSVETGLRTYRGRHELAHFYRRIGNLACYEEMLIALAAEFPEYVPARLDLADLLLHTGRRQEAERHLDTLVGLRLPAEARKHWEALRASLSQA